MVDIHKSLNYYHQERPHVWISPSICLQEDNFFILDSTLYEQCRGLKTIEVLKLLVGGRAVVLVERTGTWAGAGHGREIIAVLQPDGTLVWRRVRVAYCWGGQSSHSYSCSYSHGPWWEHGTWNATTVTISPEQSLLEVVQQFLVHSITADELESYVVRAKLLGQ